MKIQYFTDYDDEKGGFNYKYITIDISEDATIKELFLKIHQTENIPEYRELTWDGNTEKIACKHLFLNSDEENDYYILNEEDYLKKISEFPKNGPNGELSLQLDNEIGLAN